MAAETGHATIRDPGEAGGPSPSPLNTASATGGGGCLGTHGGGRDGGGDGGGHMAGAGLGAGMETQRGAGMGVGWGWTHGGGGMGVGIGSGHMAGAGRDPPVGMAAAACCHGDSSWHHMAARSPTADHGSSANDDQMG